MLARRFVFLFALLALLMPVRASAAFIFARPIPLPPPPAGPELPITDKYELFVEMEEVAAIGRVSATLFATNAHFAAVDFAGTDFFVDPGGDSPSFQIDNTGTFVGIVAFGPFSDLGPPPTEEVLEPGDRLFLGTLMLAEIAATDILATTTRIGVSAARDQINQNIIVVPEPGVLVFLVLGIASLGVRSTLHELM